MDQWRGLPIGIADWFGPYLRVGSTHQEETDFEAGKRELESELPRQELKSLPRWADGESVAEDETFQSCRRFCGGKNRDWPGKGFPK